MFSMAFPHETVRFGTSDPAHVENVEDAMQQVGTGPAWKEQAAVAAVARFAMNHHESLGLVWEYMTE